MKSVMTTAAVAASILAPIACGGGSHESSGAGASTSAGTGGSAATTSSTSTGTGGTAATSDGHYASVSFTP